VPECLAVFQLSLGMHIVAGSGSEPDCLRPSHGSAPALCAKIAGLP
jgi:hypothetical protein